MKTFTELLPSLTIAVSGALFGSAVTLFVQRLKVRRMVSAARGVPHKPEPACTFFAVEKCCNCEY